MLAASLVFCTHYKPICGPARALADEGHIGVALFLVISGAVLGRQLWQAAPQTGLPEGWRWWVGFYGRRFAKIYLLHTALYLACLPALPWHGWRELLLNLTLLKGFFPAFLFSGLPQSWTLTVELSLYLLMPALVGMGRWGRWLPVALCLAVAAWVSLGWPFGAIYTVAGRALAFALGLELARGWTRVKEKGGVDPLPVLLRLSPLLFWLLPVVSLAALLLGLGLLAPVGAHTASTDAATPEALAANTIGVPVVLFLLIGLTRLPDSALSLWVKRLLNGLGGASYAFYLIHIGPVGRIVDFASGHNILLTFVNIWALSFVIHAAFERPILKRLARKWVFR